MINTVVNYIVDRFNNDSMVNTITLSDQLIVDTQKENIYPLVAINFLNRNRTVDLELNLYTFKIHVLQQRDVRKVVHTSKLMEDTNWIDNLADCESIINNFTNYIDRIEIDENITISQLTQLTPLANYGGSGLDGFSFDIELSYPNSGYCND